MKMDAAVTRHGLEYVRAHTDEKRTLRPSSDEIDGKIASEAKGVVAYIVTTPPDAITVAVRDRWVTLNGVLDDWNERETIEHVVGHLDGVRANSIRVESGAHPPLV